jgi:Skp family chaperone for outer membrane proteins
VRNNRILVLSLVALFSGLLAAHGAEAKIAVVDMESLLKAHPDTKPAESMLQKQVDEFESEQKDMIADLDKMKKVFEAARKDANNKALSEEERDKKVTIAEAKLTDVREQEDKVRETASQRQKQLKDQGLRMRKRIVTKIRDVIKEYAGKKGYVLVVDSSALSMSGIEAVVYSEEKNDITADIRKLIDQQKSETSEKQKTETSGK